MCLLLKLKVGFKIHILIWNILSYFVFVDHEEPVASLIVPDQDHGSYHILLFAFVFLNPKKEHDHKFISN